jgi:phosphopantetheinyl transferase
MNHVLVLHARLTDASAPARLRSLLETLPYAKRLELERRDERGRHASLTGIALVLAGASRLRGRDVGTAALRFPADGRPVLDGGPWFSVSHGALTVAAALSEDAPLGFDLEETESAGPAPAAGVRRLVRWTAAEAVLKAAGRGLREVGEVVLDEALTSGRLAGRDYRITPVRLAATVVAHLATPVRVTSLIVEECPISRVEVA